MWPTASRLLAGGPGKDEIFGSNFADTLLGGSEDDTLKAWGGADTVRGEDGNDSLSGNKSGYASGDATALNGDVIDGGAGSDSLDDYDCCSPAAVSVTLDGQANDGRAGEGDNVGAIETILSTVGGTFEGSEAAETFRIFDNQQGTSTLKGNGGDDILEGARSTVEIIDGGTGNDTIEGGYGDDTLTGGPGRDAIHGDDTDRVCGVVGNCAVPQGNDTIFARDGEVDSIDCSVGTDRAVVDANDVVANCETVEKPGGQQTNPPPPGAKTCKVPKVARLKQAAALKKIKAAGCRTRVKKVRHRTIKKSRVVKTSPAATKVVKAGTVVTVHVSRGRR